MSSFENTPEDELRGYDRELKAAVDEALRMLKEGRWQFTTEPAGRVIGPQDKGTGSFTSCASRLMYLQFPG